MRFFIYNNFNEKFFDEADSSSRKIFESRHISFVYPVSYYASYRSDCESFLPVSSVERFAQMAPKQL